MVVHHPIRLPAYSRGFHLITKPVLNAIDTELPNSGIFNLFICHTSAGLCINENADPTVREDFASVFDRLVKENEPYYKHNFEGPDDMPAHIKSALVGSSISIPIIDNRLYLGTWQGIYLCEFRNHSAGRNLIASIYS